MHHGIRLNNNCQLTESKSTSADDQPTVRHFRVANNEQLVNKFVHKNKYLLAYSYKLKLGNRIAEVVLLNMKTLVHIRYKPIDFKQ